MDDLKKDSDFDTEFYVYGIFSGRLYFRGIRASQIFVGVWDLETGKLKKNQLYKLPIYTYIIANIKSFTNLDVSSNIQSMELDMLCNKLERFD